MTEVGSGVGAVGVNVKPRSMSDRADRDPDDPNRLD
jgi:hypothetical protein